MNEKPYYESPSLSDDEANVKALELLRQFDGLPVPVVRQVLRQAEFWLGAVTVLNCGGNEFQRASTAFVETSHMTDEAKALLAAATEHGAEKLLNHFHSGRAAMPSLEEIEAELGSDFLKQRGGVVVVHDASDSATR